MLRSTVYRTHASGLSQRYVLTVALPPFPLMSAIVFASNCRVRERDCMSFAFSTAYAFYLPVGSTR